jgi:hypothetical protein
MTQIFPFTKNVTRTVTMAMLGFTWQEEAFCVAGSTPQRQAQEGEMGVADIAVNILRCSW